MSEGHTAFVAGSVTRPTIWGRWQANARLRALALSVALDLATRLLFSLWGVWAVGSIPVSQQVPQYLPGPVTVYQSESDALLFGLWQQQDSLWYQKVAEFGYAPGDLSISRAPLFPLSIWLVHLVVGNYVLAGMIVADLAFMVALFLLQLLVERDFGPPVAARTALYLAIFPTAFFFHAPYTESLFLALALGTIWAARERRWLLAGGLSFLATLTRIHGVVLIIPLLIEYFSSTKPRWSRPLRWEILPLLGSLAAYGGFFLYTRLVVGDRGSFLESQMAGWGIQPAFPWSSLWESIGVVFSLRGYAVERFDLFVAILFSMLVVFSFRFNRPGDAAYAASSFLLNISHTAALTPLMSISRYVLVLYPCFALLGLGGKHPLLHWSIVAFSLVLALFWSRLFFLGFWVA